MNKIKKLHTSSDISLGNADNKTKICLCKSFLCIRVIVCNFNCKLYFFLSGQKRDSSDFFKINLNWVIHSGIVINCNGIGCVRFLWKVNLKSNSVKCFCRKIINNIDICGVNLLVEFFKFVNIKVKLYDKIINLLRSQMTGCLTLFNKLSKCLVLFFFRCQRFFVCVSISHIFILLLCIVFE